MVPAAYATLFALLVIAMGCAQVPEAEPTPDPRIDDLQRVAEEIGAAVEQMGEQVSRLARTPTPIPTVAPTSTPAPTVTPTPTASPTPGPTRAEIQAMIDSSIMAAATAVPTPTVSPTPTASPTPGPTQAEIQAMINSSITAAATAVPTPTPLVLPTPGPTLEEVEELVAKSVGEAVAAVPTSTPLVFPTPGPSIEELESVVETAIAQAIAAIPTPSAVALLTPGPLMEEVEALIERRVTEAVSAIPTATPVSLPALVAVLPQVSGPAVAPLPGNVTLRIEPGQPLAGRDIWFTLEGLNPWKSVEVEFVDPRGAAAEWITANEARFTRTNDVPVTTQTLHADCAGRVSWVRIAAQDGEGIWSVRITFDRGTTTIVYPVTQLQLPVAGVVEIGADFRRYQGSVSDTYVSSFVPTTLAVDLQAHLGWVVRRLAEDGGLHSGRIPDSYLAGTRELLKEVSRAVGVELGWEAGYFWSGQTRPGIYMLSDALHTEVRDLLSHEYVHLALHDSLGHAPRPAWFEEGLAGYFEYELRLQGERPDVSRRQFYRSADTVITAAAAGALIPLASLESNAAWRAQTDPRIVQIQYAQAHMAVRFLEERYGAGTAVSVAMNIAGGSTIGATVMDVTGISYEEFESSFVSWLREWDDPERADVLQYLNKLNDIMESERLISVRRSEELGSRLPLVERLPAKTALVADAQALLTDLEDVSAPDVMAALHGDAITYLRRFVDWLSLELEYVRTGTDARRVEANEMVPEIDVRLNMLDRDVGTVEFTYRL